MSRQRFVRQVIGGTQPTAPDIAGLRRWLVSAQPGAYLEYHRGRNLAAERSESADLTDRADLVSVLADLGAIAPAQRRITGLDGPMIAYGLTVLTTRRMPGALMRGDISPADYRVMTALVRREQDHTSITRCVRDVLATSSEKRALAWVDRARSIGWVEHSPNAKYSVTPKGRAVLV